MVEWCLNFKEKLVMLFVNSFLLSAEKEFLNGDIFKKSLRVVTEEDWIRFSNIIKTGKLALKGVG